MSFFTEQGLDIDAMERLGLGPIVFYEHIYYFNEALLGAPVNVSLEVIGHSEDGRFVMFEHNFYSMEGKNFAHGEMMFSWIDMQTRKLGKVPHNLLQLIESFPKSKEFKILTKEDTRKYGKTPRDLEEVLSNK